MSISPLADPGAVNEQLALAQSDAFTGLLLGDLVMSRVASMTCGAPAWSEGDLRWATAIARLTGVTTEALRDWCDALAHRPYWMN
jgi:hypothetical protein